MGRDVVAEVVEEKLKLILGKMGRDDDAAAGLIDAPGVLARTPIWKVWNSPGRAESRSSSAGPRAARGRARAPSAGASRPRPRATSWPGA